MVDPSGGFLFLLTDPGIRFVSQVFRRLGQIMGVRPLHPSSHHPQTRQWNTQADDYGIQEGEPTSLAWVDPPSLTGRLHWVLSLHAVVRFGRRPCGLFHVEKGGLVEGQSPSQSLVELKAFFPF